MENHVVEIRDVLLGKLEEQGKTHLEPPQKEWNQMLGRDMV
jgi:hypothetical protein